MKSTELKSNIHQLIDSIQSEQLLQSLFDFLKSRENSETGKFWNSLTEEQKNEVLLAYEESEDEDKLVDAKSVFKKLS
ncbi:hypothetical protein [Adhaeribacter pallidiroseus]|uniref:Uncharacterized protein n=1 Tax=Adhaeribacter pallidiroseus TaxID=2072847 RepID=A0A369QHI3_9BACT|nr:hypothetical protein [Adhaeribacter pallidiroseus]RDC64373.1 hypothetical protein AHMF7616_02986 [Adhaeribacter pallidiroseus]